MSKILVVGTGPLFTPEVKLFNGQALRTWHFTSPLRDAGHNVALYVYPCEGTPEAAAADGTIAQARRGTFNYSIIKPTDPLMAVRMLQEVHDAGEYDCIVAVNNNAAALACKLNSRLPLWADLNGYIMGEAQTKCLTDGSDAMLKHFWVRERIALRRADRFSTVSYKQMYATLGELGAIGRLNMHNATHPFATVVPNAAYEDFLDPACYPTENYFRGHVFPDSAFAVLWTGGFNTWTDVKSLAASLSLAMEQHNRIHFVSTGGAIPGHDEVTYQTFVSEMEKTGYADRCHLLGWVEAAYLFALYKECDLGVNVDSLNYETMFGARNRLTNLMAAGLPILTTLGTEITEIIAENNLGYVVKIGKVQEFSDAIVRAAKTPQERKRFATWARAYCKAHFTYETTTHALLKWANEPTLAPDNAEKARLYPGSIPLQEIALNPLEEEALENDRHDLRDLVRSKHELEGLKRRRSYRAIKKLFG